MSLQESELALRNREASTSCVNSNINDSLKQNQCLNSKEKMYAVIEVTSILHNQSSPRVQAICSSYS